MDAIRRAERGAERADNIDTLRGHEGEGSAAYFGVFNRLIKAEGVSFPKRVRRPPTDPVNALLSFGYALLANDIHAAVQVLGFDPYCGYLHADRYGRPSLALDLMEEFRPIIVDAVVLACLNKRILQPTDFEVSSGRGASSQAGSAEEVSGAIRRTQADGDTASGVCLSGDVSALF